MHMLNFLRLKNKTPTGREVIFGSYVTKSFENHNEGMYEYNLLMEISSSNSQRFSVPKPLSIIRIHGKTLLFMERVSGRSLDSYIFKALLTRDLKVLRTFYRLGAALREFHELNLNGLRECQLPSSSSQVKTEIISNITRSSIFDHKLISLIDSKDAYVSDKIFSEVTMHGEFYFTHILISSKNDKFIFFDFHKSCKGPAYFDLAMFAVSLYVSLPLFIFPIKSFSPLVEAFLKGYYRENYDIKLLNSFKLALLYVALREIQECSKILRTKQSRITKLITLLKMQRLRNILKQIVLSETNVR